MKRIAYAVITFLFMAASPSLAQPGIDEIIKKVEARFEPAEAKPGQTVTLKVSLKLLDGWHTYPTVQPDKGARAQANKLTFPEGGPVVYVGDFDDPPGAKEKAEPMLSIERMLYYPGGATWERKAVVLPSTKAGPVSSKIKFRVLVCDKDNCLPPKTIELEATLKVTGDPVPVDPKYKSEVEKAQKK
jgi:hypothetical protein